MISVFKETKFYFENLFHSDWDETDIHYAGQEFDSSNIEKWVNPFYQPLFGSHKGLCDATTNGGNLHVVCWADTDVDAMELSDLVVSFINTNIDKTKYSLTRFEIADHGWNENNKVFVIVTFSFNLLAS